MTGVTGISKASTALKHCSIALLVWQETRQTIAYAALRGYNQTRHEYADSIEALEAQRLTLAHLSSDASEYCFIGEVSGCTSCPTRQAGSH
jgi:hypothetical protein